MRRAVVAFGRTPLDTPRLIAERAAAAARTAELEDAARRARLGAEHARRHLALLAEGSRALVAGLDDEAVALRSLAAAIVPSFADWCAIDIVDDGEVRRVATAHADPAALARLPMLLSDHSRWAVPVRRVMATGQAELVWDASARPLHPEDADHLGLLCVLGLVSALTAPIRIQGLSVGAISCGTAAERRGFRPSDVAAVEELAARTAMAIERISLYRETQRSAAETAERAAQLASAALENSRLYESVRAKEAHLVALVEASPLAILELDLTGSLRRTNSAAVRLLGGDEAPAGDFALHPDTAALLGRLAADTLAGEPVTDLEIVDLRADGSEVPVSLAGARLQDAAGAVEGVVVMAADVTIRRQLEDQLVRARRIEAVGQLAGGVAHDFNNLLTVILGHAALLDAGLDEGDARLADVQAIAMAAERAAGVTSQLLTLSRGDPGAVEAFDPRERLRRLAPTLRSLLPGPVELSLALEPGQALVRVSPAQFDQVVLNLAVNGRDAVSGSGCLTVALREEDRSVVIDVTDTGAGMDAATAERCFEPFFSTKGRGTGLGLATVHTVVTGVGGNVSLSSVPGQGTTFTVRLPLVEGEVAAGAPPRPHARAGFESILLVEDEEGLRRLLVEVLRGDGYVVTPAADGQAALLLAADTPPDLVVTDVVMPRVGGVELAERLAVAHPDVPVLFMTGYVDLTSREGLVGADVLIKPFVITELVARVEEALDRASATRRFTPSSEARVHGSKR